MAGSRIASPSDLRRGALALLAAIPLAFAALGLIEAARVPLERISLAAVLLAIGECYLALGVVAPAMLIAALAALAAARWPRVARALPGLAAVGAALGAGLSYLVLIGYPRFAGHPPFLVAWGGLGLALAALHLAIATGRWPRLTVAAGLAAVGVALAGLVAAARFRDYYPTLHVSLGLARALLLHAGIAAIVRAATTTPRRAALVAAPGLALLAAGGLATGLIATQAEARRALAEHTVLGPAAVLEGGPVDDACATPPPPLDAAAADAALAAAMPALPAGLDLAGLDVLVVMAEAIRFDQTGLAGKPTTPNLVRLAAGGAHVFERAYAPASRTWLSLAAIFAMATPSQAAIKTRVPAWTGDLLPEAETVAERYAAAGYETLAFRHDFEGNVGLNQGFATVHEEPGRVIPREAVDRNLVLRAIDALAAPASRPRFTWLFLVSPHEPYLAPASTFEGYAAGVANVDAELGRVLAALERSGRADRTIVVFAADHGEEFREHGHFARHGLTLYEEVVHVPLVVRIPGAPGGRFARPVTLAALFPWLMSRAEPPLRAAARAAVAERLGPVWRATDGATVMENLDETESYLALVAGDHKAHLDFRTGRLEVYDLATDPGERADLAPTGGPAVAAIGKQVEAYRAVRACTRRAEIGAEPGPTRNNLQRTPAVPYAPTTELGRAAAAAPP